MDGLPFLPGNTFQDVTKNRFHVSHTLGYKNGYRIPIRPTTQVGGQTIPFNQLSDDELAELANYKPTLTYGQSKQAPPEAFIPTYVAFDKQVLRFYAWFKQTVHESQQEHFRVRPVYVYYYLEDDSVEIVEPRVKNSGMPQGCLVQRQRLPKDDVGNNYTWKDLNNGVNVTAYGKVFHLYDCDKFTRDWLDSEGIELNAMEDCPLDPYTEFRRERETVQMAKTPSDFDKLRQFLEMDRKVLRFYCVWDDRDRMFGQLKKFILHYYLSDDTMELVEVRVVNDGYDPFPMFMRRHRCAKNRDDIEPDFPLGAMEITDEEVKEYYSPTDFAIGKNILIYGRRFLIYDVDNFTKSFYWKNFGQTDFTPLDVSVKRPELPKSEVPPYNMHGSLDDSMQNLRKVVPEPPKRDYVKYLSNQGKVLRYEARFDMPRKEERCRRFIVIYDLADDTIAIYEPRIDNSGFTGGKYLEKTRVARPGSRPDAPTYYGPQDFYIGAVVDIFRKRFVIVDADYYVLKYMEEHVHQFPEITVRTLREKLQGKGCVDPCRPLAKSGPLIIQRSGECGELENIVEDVKKQLRRLAITTRNESGKIFLDLDVDRVGYVTKQNLREMFIKHNLPCGDDIIECLAGQLGRDPEHITADEIRKFLEDA